MNKCWISFYLSIWLFFSFPKVQRQTIPPFIFSSVKNIVAAPTSNKDWTILPAKPYTLKYEISIDDGIISDAKSGEICEGFTTSPGFSVEKINTNHKL